MFNKRKIYACCTMYNEVELLEIKLQEMFDHVDRFVIAEANTTHAGTPKPYNFLDNIDRFKPYLDKITYIKVTDMPGVIAGSHYFNERFQRDSLIRGLAGVTDDDVVIIGDLDEITRGSVCDFIRNDKTHGLWGLRTPTFLYKLNYMWTKPLIFQVHSTALRVQVLKQFMSLSYIREVYGNIWVDRAKNYDVNGELCIPHAGWHFSTLGSSDDIAYKITLCPHNDEDKVVRNKIASTFNLDTEIANGTGSVVPGARFEVVQIDDYYPKAILNNQEKYAHLIIPTDTASNVGQKLSVIDMSTNIEY